MKTDRTVVRLLLLAGMVLAVRSASAEPMGTAFTYQGYLERTGAPVNDTCDFEFSVWDADVGGSKIAGVRALNGVEKEIL